MQQLPRSARASSGRVARFWSTIASREYFLDAQGRMWYATPSNNKVGYFYLAGRDGHGAMAKNAGQ
jgi:hypothetical protein